ncbi:hypothetical protein ABG808_05995 [Streptococcus iniae]
MADKSLELIGQTNELYDVLFNDIVKDDQSYKRDDKGYILFGNW